MRAGASLRRGAGLILVDTKYEFGFDDSGAIVLADEVHTPDSSRYWLQGTYAAKFEAGQAPDTFDKDFVRRWVVSQCDPYKDPIPPIPEDVILQAAAIYVTAFEKITGKRFPLPDPCRAAADAGAGELAEVFRQGRLTGARASRSLTQIAWLQRTKRSSGR